MTRVLFRVASRRTVLNSFPLHGSPVIVTCARLRLRSVDVVVAVAADHEGLSSPFGHGLRPRLRWLSGLDEIGQPAHVVHLHLRAPAADLTSTVEEPVDQLFVRIDGPCRDAVVDGRSLVPHECRVAEPGDQWCPCPRMGGLPRSTVVARSGCRSWPCACRPSSSPSIWPCARLSRTPWQDVTPATTASTPSP